MRIDPTTLLFHDLSDDEAKVLQDAGEAIMLRGEVPHPMPAIINQWFERCHFSHDRGLLVVSTVLPARIFYSLLLRKSR
jgi:hypothetical protein